MRKTDQTRTGNQERRLGKLNAKATDKIVALPVKANTQRASDKVVSFVKRHPVIVVAGGLAVGAAVSALLPRGGTRKWFGKAVNLAEAAGATSLLFGREASDKARALGRDARSSLLGSKAEKAAADGFEKYGLAALAAAESLSRAAARKASQLSEAAAEQSDRALQKAQELRDRVTH